MKRKILVAPSSFGATDSSPRELLISHGFEIIPNPYGRKLAKEELLSLLPGVCGLVAGLETLDREVLEKSSLKAVSRCGSGTSNIDLKAASDLGIVISATPDGPANAVAELTIGMILSLIRLVPEMDRNLHSGMWDKKIGFELGGRTVAVIGLGRIGRRVAEFLHAFGARVIGIEIADISLPDYIARKDLKDALPLAEVIVLHASGDGEILGVKQFELIKKGVFLLNPARGGLINEQALVQALESGQVRGAWLDTFGEEPYRGPLARFSQVILTPHIGSYTAECRKKMETDAALNLIEALRNKL